MSRKYFGTDGVRGTVGKAPITPDFVLRLAYAAGRVLIDHNQQKPTVLIGKDTRISGYMLEAALQAGFTAAGVHVLLTGPLPTPGVAYLTRTLRLSAGVMISASHNPFDDNGIKFFSSGGKKLDDALEIEIENMLEEGVQTLPSVQLGRARRIDGATERYIEFCKSSFPNELNLHQLKIVVDSANGAAYDVAPKVFHELGAEVISIGNEPSGFNINDKVGTTYPQTLREAVLQHQADYGIALDGDGDRLIMVDKNGQIYDGDQLIYVIAKAKAQKNELKGGVVGTIMTNIGMELALKEKNIQFVRANVGDRYVLDLLQQKDWQLGGEASGHILCLDKHNTGDGIISALQVLKSLDELSLSLAEACSDWRPFPQTLINVCLTAIEKEEHWQERVKPTLELAQQALKDCGRVVLRKSGTESVIRVMVEANDASLAEIWANKIAVSIDDLL